MDDKPRRRFRLTRCKPLALALVGSGVVYLFATLEVVTLWAFGVPMIKMPAFVLLAALGLIMLVSGVLLWRRDARRSAAAGSRS